VSSSSTLPQATLILFARITFSVWTVAPNPARVPRTVMLVDDDEDNIDAALGGGHLSWHFRDGSVAELRAELKKLRQEG